MTLAASTRQGEDAKTVIFLRLKKIGEDPPKWDQDYKVAPVRQFTSATVPVIVIGASLSTKKNAGEKTSAKDKVAVSTS